jgi:type VI secretion system protein VasD
MKRLYRFLLWSLVGATSLLSIACPKAPARVNISMSASPNINPDPAGQALSVVVRVYQLKDKGRLEAADYNAIWKSDKETLSDDFLDRQERVIQPGTQEMMEVKANPMAAYLGVVALFRNPAGDSWRKIISISGKTPKIKISLNEHSIDVTSVGK